MSDQLWSWVLTACGLAGFYFAGRKQWWAWYINIANQILWLAYSIITQQWGFLVGVVFYTAIFAKNAYEWTKEEFKRRDRALQAEIDLELARADVDAIRAERQFIHDAQIPSTKVGYCHFKEKRLDPATGYQEFWCSVHNSFSHYSIRNAGSLLPCIAHEEKLLTKEK